MRQARDDQEGIREAPHSADASTSLTERLRLRVRDLLAWAAGIGDGAPVDPVRDAVGDLESALDELGHLEDDVWPLVHGRAAPPQEFRALFEGMERATTAEGRLRDLRGIDLARASHAEAKAAADTARTFLANTSHEIRNPLNTIIGFGELLRETELTAEQRHFVEALQRGSQHLLRLSSDLLDIAKAEAGKLSLDAVEFDLADLGAHATRDAAMRSRTKDVEISCLAASDLPRRVVGDPGRLRQVLDNLLENACKFTDRGRILLEIAPEPVAAEESEECTIRFAVSDSGRGIAPERVSLVFDPFVRDDVEVGDGRRGTGLGLAVAKRLVESMGGAIEVESGVGRGTTFRFTARLKTARPVEAALATSLAGVSVLVIGGESIERDALAELLRGWGAATTQIDDGLRALALLQGGLAENAVALLAGRTKELNGFKIVEALRDDPATLRRIVFLLPSRHRPGDGEHLERQGIGACAVMPIGPADLLGALLRVSRPNS